MRRLYSTFARGWPGLGLLLIRFVVAAVLIARSGLIAPFPFAISAVCAVLILSGLWTPMVGAVIALFEAWQLLTLPGDRWFAVLVGSVGAALAMLGPGWWSADAHLFGWKRIEGIGGKNVSKFR